MNFNFDLCYNILIKFIYSKKATKFCEISTIDLSYVVTVKSSVEILQNFVTFSEYMNFTKTFKMHLVHVCKVQVLVPNLEFKYWRVSTRFGIYWAVADISVLLKRSSISKFLRSNLTFTYSTYHQDTVKKSIYIFLGNQSRASQMIDSYTEAQLMGMINLM